VDKKSLVLFAGVDSEICAGCYHSSSIVIIGYVGGVVKLRF